jgi:hypothetical protein
MASQILAYKQAFGVVSLCPHGCIHIEVGRISISLTEVEYAELVALINESAANYELLRHPKGAQETHVDRPKLMPKSGDVR